MSQPKYRVSLKLADKTYTKIGSTIADALDALDLSVKVGGKGIFQVKYGKLRAEVFLYPRMIKKLAVNQLSRQLFQKRLLTALK